MFHKREVIGGKEGTNIKNRECQITWKWVGGEYLSCGSFWSVNLIWNEDLSTWSCFCREDEIYEI